MNLIQIANDVKMLNDQQLQQIMQNPGQTPQYIIAGEMQRRQKLREDASTPNQQGTVVETLMNKVNQENEAKKKQSMMPMNEALPQGMGQPNIRGMASGGVVRMARGERPDEGSGEGSGGDDDLQKIDINELLKNFKPYVPVQRPQAPDLTTQDYLAALAPRIAEMESRAKQYEKGALSRALMKAGAAMMASKNSSALGGIGEGFGAGLEGYSGDKSSTTKDLQAMLGMRSAIAQAQQQGAEALANRKMNLYGHDMGAAITDAQANNSYGLNQSKAAIDAFNWNAALPSNRAELSYKMAQIPYMAAMADNTRANTAATKQNTLMNNTKNDPVAQVLWGLNNGDETAVKSGMAAASLEQRMRIQQILTQGQAYQMRSTANTGAALDERRQEQALKETNDAVDNVLKKNVGFGLLPPEEQIQKRQALVESLFPQFYAKLAKGGPGGAPVAAAEKPRFSFNLKDGIKPAGK